MAFSFMVAAFGLRQRLMTNLDWGYCKTLPAALWAKCPRRMRARHCAKHANKA